MRNVSKQMTYKTLKKIFVYKNFKNSRLVFKEFLKMLNKFLFIIQLKLSLICNKFKINLV